MTPEDLIFKLLKVITSCKTLEQLTNAHRYYHSIKKLLVRSGVPLSVYCSIREQAEFAFGHASCKIEMLSKEK